MTKKLAEIIPLNNVPLIHCITNDITLETLANTILYLGGKPIMSSDVREFADLFKTTDALLLNMGRLTVNHEASLREASHFAVISHKPVVVDLVGYGMTEQRRKLGDELINHQPTIVKGNISEMRRLVGLPTIAKGIDGDVSDQSDFALQELNHALKELCKRYPKTVFVATGRRDIVVQGERSALLCNGVAALDRFVGTGDMLGAIMATLIGAGAAAWEASSIAISYLNIASEIADNQTHGLENFRQEMLNQISLLQKKSGWSKNIHSSTFN